MFLMILRSFIRLELKRLLFTGKGHADDFSHLEIAHLDWPSLMLVKEAMPRWQN